MELVQYVVPQRRPGPGTVLPVEHRVDDGGWAVDALGLGPRCRVGEVFAIIQPVEVQAPRRQFVDYAVVVAALARVQGHQPFGLAQDAYGHALREWGPDDEASQVIAQGLGA